MAIYNWYEEISMLLASPLSNIFVTSRHLNLNEMQSSPTWLHTRGIMPDSPGEFSQSCQLIQTWFDLNEDQILYNTVILPKQTDNSKTKT